MRYIVLLFFSFFLVSCGDSGTTGGGVGVVGPGSGSWASIFTKSCEGGHFTVSRSGGGLIDSSSYTNVQGLPEGAQVQVSGVINSATCLQGSSLSFTCTGSISIGTYRAITCSSGSLNYTPSNYTNPASNLLNTLTPQSSQFTTPGVGGANFVGGQFHTYSNGTKAYASIVINDGVGGTCPASFTCK